MDKSTEYQQVAALVCQDIDIFLKCAERWPDQALEFFRELKKKKDQAVSDPEHRAMRYNAGCVLYSVAAASPKNSGDMAEPG